MADLSDLESEVLQTFVEAGGVQTCWTLVVQLGGRLEAIARRDGERPYDLVEGAVQRLKDRNLLVERELIDRRWVYLMGDAAGEAMDLSASPPPPSGDEPLWLQFVDYELRLVIREHFGMTWAASLEEVRELVLKPQLADHFAADPARFDLPVEPQRAAEQGEKLWKFVHREWQRERRVKEIFRESIQGAAERWIEHLVGQVPRMVQPAPRWFVDPSHRVYALLLRARRDPPRSWERQMDTLLRVPKLLVVPSDEVQRAFAEITEPDYGGTDFAGDARRFYTELESVTSPGAYDWIQARANPA